MPSTIRRRRTVTIIVTLQLLCLLGFIGFHVGTFRHPNHRQLGILIIALSIFFPIRFLETKLHSVEVKNQELNAKAANRSF